LFGRKPENQDNKKQVEAFYNVKLISKLSLNMKNWQKFIAFAFLAALFVLESCNRGYGCPGADL